MSVCMPRAKNNVSVWHYWCHTLNYTTTYYYYNYYYKLFVFVSGGSNVRE